MAIHGLTSKCTTPSRVNKMNIHTYPTIRDLNIGFANWLVDYIKQVLAKQERFAIALSGGNTPKAFYQLLAEEPYKSSIDWQRIHFFWGDERYVPFKDASNNALMAFETLLNKVPISLVNVYPINTELSPEDSAKAYQNILHQYFDNQPLTFDLVLLGLGDNGHTLSLFPYTEILHEQTDWVKSFWLEEQDMFRISLTVPVTNQAAVIAFLVSGDSKANMVKKIIEGEKDTEKYPAQLIEPDKNGVLHWFLDDYAAKLLQKPKNQLS